jgi:hypothetical protein
VRGIARQKIFDDDCDRGFFYVLRLFGDNIRAARRKYNEYVHKGIETGRREDLVGGGLVRSAGGWVGVKSLRKSGILLKGDERILGSEDFVELFFPQATEGFEKKYSLKAKGVDIARIAERVAEIFGMLPDEVWASGKQAKTVRAEASCAIGRSTNSGSVRPI